jgi:signal transduction histidine kinase
MISANDAMNDGLADFILGNLEIILLKWDAFARSIWPGPIPDPVIVRDDAEEMLHSLVRDMKSEQSPSDQVEKSRGNRDMDEDNPISAGASSTHAQHRISSGFDVLMLISEYRALRANILKLWLPTLENGNLRHLQEVTRFNECIDQLLANSSRYFNERLETSRRTFLGILGHDLRTPLYAVSMLSEVLARKKGLDPDSAELAGRIASSASAMGSMIKDLLDFTGAQLGAGMAINLESLDLQNLCKEIAQELEAANPGSNLVLDFKGDLIVHWDRGRIRQMISNLLGNAVQHGSSGTPILLRAEAGDNEVRIKVHNHGKPIDQETIGLIFEPMGRSHVAESARPAGSIGLGLYIAREVAFAHEGTIEVTSTYEEGTAFTVTIPIAPLT